MASSTISRKQEIDPTAEEIYQDTSWEEMVKKIEQKKIVFIEHYALNKQTLEHESSEAAQLLNQWNELIDVAQLFIALDESEDATTAAINEERANYIISHKNEIETYKSGEKNNESDKFFSNPLVVTSSENEVSMPSQHAALLPISLDRFSNFFAYCLGGYRNYGNKTANNNPECKGSKTLS